MQIQAWDEVFVRCRRQRANELTIDVATWGQWWPGLSVTGGESGHDLRFRPTLRFPRAHDLHLDVDRIRPRDKGLEFTVQGDITGTGEWFHLDQPNGVVINYLVRGQAQGLGARKLLRAHRASVRAALTGLKRRLEAGRLPGAEPHPELLVIQQQELIILAREVAAHQAKLAAAKDTI